MLQSYLNVYYICVCVVLVLQPAGVVKAEPSTPTQTPEKTRSLKKSNITKSSLDRGKTC